MDIKVKSMPGLELKTFRTVLLWRFEGLRFNFVYRHNFLPNFAIAYLMLESSLALFYQWHDKG